MRFGTDLWQLLETESARVGVSVSQYIREAALARASAAAAARGEGPFQLLADALRETMGDDLTPAERAQIDGVLSGLARIAAASSRSESRAVRAQSRQAKNQARHTVARARSELGD